MSPRDTRRWFAVLAVIAVAVIVATLLAGCAPTDDGPSDASKSADVREHNRVDETCPSD